jgi:AbrB family looped-hinge helix DNA binding protein
MKEIKVTRKYQITIPSEIRKSLGVKIGEKYPIKRVKNKIIIETKKHVERPSDYLWSISKKQINRNAVNLVKNSREKMR